MKKLALLFLFAAACAGGRTPSVAPPPPSSNVQWDISNIPNDRVDYWITRFQSDKRAEFASYLDRMKQYEPMITAKLRDRQMPHDLLYLAMIESGFNPEAHSVANARGIWQLTPDTARLYKLRVDDTLDERLDPEKSTDAALEFLRDLYGRFGSWYLAAAAYNAGANRVGDAMKEVMGAQFGTDADYYRIWDRLPGETRDYVPVMIAAARIAKDPARYGF